MNSHYIKRQLLDEFCDKVRKGKALILLGARRVGKTELIKTYLEKLNTDDYLLFNGDDQSTIDLFSERTVNNYKRILKNCKIVVIDEAQKIPDIGIKLKLIVDSFREISVVATGSSVFHLHNQLGEPLVGRSNVLYLFPLSQSELSENENFIQTKEKFEERMIFGSYPEIEQYSNWEEKMNYLDGIVNNYLLRDILDFEGIKKSEKLFDLLRLIAFQIGKEVSIEELSSNLKGISRNTVENYLDLLSKVFVIYKVRGFSKNLRKEITKSSRWYFYDNGIRNAIIRNFSRFHYRNDVGEMWENYLMSERIKYNAYNKQFVNYYFWRTYDQQEIDLVEEKNGRLHAFEFKWNIKKHVKIPGAWESAYPEATFQVINQENYLDFIT